LYNIKSRRDKMTNEVQKKRAKITGITINVTHTDGTSGTITIDPRITKALFWDDQTVLEILGSYYKFKSKKPKMTKKVMEDLFGTIGKKVAGGEEEITVDEEIIKKLWTEEDENGNSLTMLSKSIFCIPGPGGDG
jgi:hypothetical protein